MPTLDLAREVFAQLQDLRGGDLSGDLLATFTVEVAEQLVVDVPELPGGLHEIVHELIAALQRGLRLSDHGA